MGEKLMKYYVLYNPIAGGGVAEQEVKKLDGILSGEIAYFDVTQIQDYQAFMQGLAEDGIVVICGGDGTLNRFVNNAKDALQGRKVLYFACGSGNDFLRDVEHTDGQPVELNPYIENLPVVSVNGKEYYFLNGVGYGIDGYCCEVGDELRLKSDKSVNYAGIAIKGLLFHYKPTGATVIVDGKEYRFEKVWLAPTMNGRFYGGGMLPAPEQRRENDKVSVMLFHGSGKLKSLMMFPSIFKGEHVKYEKHITVLSGNEITVKFDEPRALQIDGETIRNVSEYTARK